MAGSERPASPVLKAAGWTRFPFSLTVPRELVGCVSGRENLEDGSEDGKTGEEGILLTLMPSCRVFGEENNLDLLFRRSNRFTSKWIV